ncbi:sialate O-acetylesterase isoform X2 [Rhinatrema bivittatum]|uniref:sialate O-acetylesterase isoform X2 n=1 Tax=Rhinatrema bivittatum TaxID=194408 RepID=UPI001125EEC1|nr:sialate O-acetylesterase isoform X2 [Rhinatrema bivittatum]
MEWPYFQLSAFFPTYAEFRLASYFADRMVLQKEPAGAVIWGEGDVGAVVKVIVSQNLNAISKKTVKIEGDVGTWKVVLDPMSPGGPYEITAEQYFRGEVKNVSLQDVLFGDVWLCGGQSNMEMTVLQIMNANKELSEVLLYPHIRVFTASLVQAQVELDDLAKIDLQWSVPTAENIGEGDFTYFSAVCWLFGRYLYNKLQYPIGLVESCWGGTPIESWSSKRALEKCGLNTMKSQIKRSGSMLWSYDIENEAYGPQIYSVLWNAMIHPLLNMTIKGAIWYQGEANTGLNMDLYNCTFPAMIEDWRRAFHEGSLGQTDKSFPFGFVQLSTYQHEETRDCFPRIRWHQTADYGYAPNPKMPNTFMAVAMDLCDEKSPYGSIHPRYKREVAYRLSLGARAVAYGEKDVIFQGPYPQKITVVQTDAFLNITYDQRLLRNLVNTTFEVCCPSQLAKDGVTEEKWLPAAIISATLYTITVSFKGCCKGHIAGIRYAWTEWPCLYKDCPLYSIDTLLPAPPFIRLFSQLSEDIRVTMIRPVTRQSHVSV